MLLLGRDAGDTFLHHELPAGTSLLSRLEHQPHAACQLRLMLLEDPGCPQELCHMRIMPAGMHSARRLTPAGFPSFFHSRILHRARQP